MIDTITFDLWNTLISNSPLDNLRYKGKRVEGIHRILRQTGLDVKFDHLASAYDEGFEKCNETWRKNQDLSTEEQLKIMFDLLEDEESRNIPPRLMSELVEVFVSPILVEPPPLVDGARELLQEIKKDNYKIGLICNTGRTPGKTIRVLLERFGMINYFIVTTFSNELRIRKPDPRIFLCTLNQLKSHPKDSLHVGDMVELDVLGAKRAGMVSVHFHPDQIPYSAIRSQDAVRRFDLAHRPELVEGQAHRPVFDSEVAQTRGEQSRRTEFEPDFSIKELNELKIILQKVK